MQVTRNNTQINQHLPQLMKVDMRVNASMMLKQLILTRLLIGFKDIVKSIIIKIAIFAQELSDFQHLQSLKKILEIEFTVNMFVLKL